MGTAGHQLVETYAKLVAREDVAALGELYAPDAEVVRYDGAARGRAEIPAFLISRAAALGGYELMSIEQFQETDDVILWEATVETTQGILETSDVMVIDENGLIRRHFPGIRGYWGQ